MKIEKKRESEGEATFLVHKLLAPPPFWCCLAWALNLNLVGLNVHEPTRTNNFCNLGQFSSRFGPKSMEKMSILMGKLGQQKVASGPGQKKKLVLFGWVCLHEHPPFWQFILPFFPSHAGVLRRTTPYVCNAFQWLWNLSTNLCLFLKFLRSVKKGPPSLNQARTELICYPAISLGLNSDILSILLIYDPNPPDQFRRQISNGHIALSSE